MTPLTVDVHGHLVGMDEAANGCICHERMRGKLSTRGIMKLAGARWGDPTVEVDRKFVDLVLRSVDASPSLDRLVLYALDGAYREEDGTLDRERTSLHVPNEYAFSVAARHEKLWVGASVHPYRKDALEELERCARAGAVLVKWLPAVQGIDPASPRCEPFYRKLVELGLPLVSHVGVEFALPNLAPELGTLERLEKAMAAGVRVVVPHAGDVALLRDREDFERLLSVVLRYPQVLLDDSALALAHRGQRLLRIADRPELWPRILHGSDFPLPSHPWRFVHRLGVRKARAIAALPSPLERDLAIKRELGLDEAIFTRASTILRVPR